MIPIDQRKADMEDPAQHAGWAVSSIPPPDGNEEMPDLVLPVLYLPVLSTHLWRTGFRHHPELQEIEQDIDGDASLRSSGVKWVPIGTRAPEEPAPVIDLSGLSDTEIAAVQAALDARRGKR